MLLAKDKAFLRHHLGLGFRGGRDLGQSAVLWASPPTCRPATVTPKVSTGVVNAQQPFHCSSHLKSPWAHEGGGHCKGVDPKTLPTVARFCRGIGVGSGCPIPAVEGWGGGGWCLHWAPQGERGTPEGCAFWCLRGTLRSRQVSPIQSGGVCAHACCVLECCMCTHVGCMCVV